MPLSFLPRCTIVGGDQRQIYLKNILAEHGFLVSTYTSGQTLISPQLLLTPIPFTKDNIHIFQDTATKELLISDFLAALTDKHHVIGGYFPKEVLAYFKLHQIPFFDYSTENNFLYPNAIATAEGAIMKAIEKSTTTLFQSNILVTGFGRCGFVLADKLRALGAHVTICARNEAIREQVKCQGYAFIHLEDLSSHLAYFDFIFNTIPKIIFTKEILAVCNSRQTFIDIASLPGGLDFVAAHELDLNTFLFLGIPGKTAPHFAAKVIYQMVLDYIVERSEFYVPDRL